MTEDAVRRKCERGEFEFAEKVGAVEVEDADGKTRLVGGRWFINFDRTMGKAAPVRAQPVNVDELGELVASKLWQAFTASFASLLPTTRFYRR